MVTDTLQAPGPNRVLLVDDRPDNLIALEAVLQPLGLECRLRQLRAQRRFTPCSKRTSPRSSSTRRCLTAWTASRRANPRQVAWPPPASIPIMFLTAIDHDLEHQLHGYEGRGDRLHLQAVRAKPVESQGARPPWWNCPR